MNFFRPSVFGYPARPPLSLPPSLYPPLEVGPLAIPVYDYSSQMKVYLKDSMDRFGDDLTELILSYLIFEDKIRLECVSKQWKRCVFQRQFVIEIQFMREWKNQNSLNGLFRRNDDERPSDEQRLVSVMKKCQNITKVSISRKKENEVIEIMHRYYPDVQVDNIEDLLNSNLNSTFLPLPENEYIKQVIKGLLTSNRYAFDSEVLSLFGQYCPNIKSLQTTITGEQDLAFFRMYGHKLKELTLFGPTDSIKDYLKFCPNLKKIHFDETSILLNEDKEFLPKLENIQSIFEINSSNVNEMKSLVDKYSQKVKYLWIFIYELTAKELKTCVDCICGFGNSRFLFLSIRSLKFTQPIDESIAMIGRKCTKLLKFEFSYDFDIDLFPISDRFFDVFFHFKAITRLDIFLPNFGAVIGSVECFKHCKQLKHLDINYNGLTEDFFIHIATFVPKLQSLEISTDEKFSNSFINSFHSMKNIQKIGLRIKKI